jgi:branched-chain amino acid transport system substrate-binding protein
VSRLATILIAASVTAAMLGGCGEEGAAAGATVRVYVSAPLRGAEAPAGRRLCAEAREQAAQGQGGGDLRLRVVCLDAAAVGGRWTLARVGANARRATEDSTTIAYLGEPDPAARRQSGSILEAAGIARLGGAGGRAAIARVEAALREGDANDPRSAVLEEVEG